MPKPVNKFKISDCYLKERGFPAGGWLDLNQV